MELEEAIQTANSSPLSKQNRAPLQPKILAPIDETGYGSPIVWDTEGNGIALDKITITLMERTIRNRAGQFNTKVNHGSSILCVRSPTDCLLLVVVVVVVLSVTVWSVPLSCATASFESIAVHHDM